jgi:hypothetical protein
MLKISEKNLIPTYRKMVALVDTIGILWLLPNVLE